MYALHNSTITCMHVLLDVLLFSRDNHQLLFAVGTGNGPMHSNLVGDW